MDWSQCDLVEVVPGKVSGAPIIRGTRVQADAVLDNYNDGESVEDIAENFFLKPDDVRRLLDYASGRRVAMSHVEADIRS